MPLIQRVTTEPVAEQSLPPPFAARTSKVYQLWVTVFIGGGLSGLIAFALLPAMPNGVWHALAVAIAGLPLAASTYVLVLMPRRELHIDANGWRISGFHDEPVPWPEVRTYAFVPFPRGVSKSTIAMEMARPHRDVPRWTQHGWRSPGCRVWGDRSVELIAIGWDQPAFAIFSAFEQHIEADRVRRKAAVHTTAVIPPST